MNIHDFTQNGILQIRELASSVLSLAPEQSCNVWLQSVGLGRKGRTLVNQGTKSWEPQRQFRPKYLSPTHNIWHLFKYCGLEGYIWASMGAQTVKYCAFEGIWVACYTYSSFKEHFDVFQITFQSCFLDALQHLILSTCHKVSDYVTDTFSDLQSLQLYSLFILGLKLVAQFFRTTSRLE